MTVAAFRGHAEIVRVLLEAGADCGSTRVRPGGVGIGRRAARCQWSWRTADGWKHWLHWNEVCLRPSGNGDMNENKILRADAGQNLSFTRVVARRK